MKNGEYKKVIWENCREEEGTVEDRRSKVR